MKIQLSDHFTYSRLLRYVFPSIVMMIFTSIYSIVDGLFVSNYVGKTPFAAINLIYPVLSILGTLGFMIGTGGTAVVAKTLGEGKKDLANRYFSMMIYVVAAGGILVAVLGQIFLKTVAKLLGAEGEMLKYCVLYGRILLFVIPAFLLQVCFQSFFTAAEKPKLGLVMTVVAGMTNIILDYILIAVVPLGLAGAAFATGISQMVGGFVPFLYFAWENTSLLRLVRIDIIPGWASRNAICSVNTDLDQQGIDWRIIRKACINGSSELMSSLSSSLVTMLYNFQLMAIAGEDGIAAYGVIMYANFIFVAIFLGYSIGSAPIVGYHYGAGNHRELQSLFRKSLVLIGITGVLLTGLAMVSADTVAKVFVGYDPDLYRMTARGFQLYAYSFLICGVNIFGSAFFTALNDGLVSAVISFLRTMFFQIAAILVLPLILGIDGIWLAIVAAELLSLVVTVGFFAGKRKKYHYL